MKVIARVWAKEIGTTPILNKPMLWWTLSQAKKAGFIDEVFVWAENEELAWIAESSGCHAVLGASDQDFGVDELFYSDVWSTALSERIMSVCGTLGDVRLFLSCGSCLMTAEVLEDMFVKLMEDMVSDTIIPVTKTEPYLYMENPKSGRLFPFWIQPGVDRQDYPDLYRSGTTRFRHTLRRPGIRVLYHELDPDFMLEVKNLEDADLAEYYLSLRLGGKIILPERVEGLGRRSQPSPFRMHMT